MSKFLEIGEIIDFLPPKVEVIAEKIAIPFSVKSERSSALPFLIGIGVIGVIIYLIKKENEKDISPRNQS